MKLNETQLITQKLVIKILIIIFLFWSKKENLDILLCTW